ncbi:hypothetical protein D3C73_668100 [compost metagenome]
MPLPLLTKPVPPLSTIVESMVNVPVPFCWMPNVPPPAPPVMEPPVTRWFVASVLGATMIVPSIPSVFPAPIVTTESAAAV